MPQFADELARLLDLLEPFVGQPLEQRAHPIGVGNRCQIAGGEPGIGGVDAEFDAVDHVAGRVHADRGAVLGGLVVVRELEELKRGDPAAGLFELALLLPFAAQLVGVDPDPAIAGVQQRRSGLLRAFELGVGDLLVTHDELPFDERLAAELLLAIVLRCRSRLAGDAHGVADQPLRTDEFDTGLLEFERRDVDEVLSRFEVELDAGRLVLECQVGEPGYDRRDACDDVVEQCDQRVEMARLASDLDGAFVAVPQVGRPCTSASSRRRRRVRAALPRGRGGRAT